MKDFGWGRAGEAFRVGRSLDGKGGRAVGGLGCCKAAVDVGRRVQANAPVATALEAWASASFKAAPPTRPWRSRSRASIGLALCSIDQHDDAAVRGLISAVNQGLSFRFLRVC